MEKIKVLIADDHRVVREGLAAILKTKDDINVIGEAQDGMEAVEKTKTLMPDVILMDVSMPRMGGVEATRQIKREFPHIGIVALTMYEEQQYIVITSYSIHYTKLYENPRIPRYPAVAWRERCCLYHQSAQPSVHSQW